MVKKQTTILIRVKVIQLMKKMLIKKIKMLMNTMIMTKLKNCMMIQTINLI